jgi:hypothetical protein
MYVPYTSMQPSIPKRNHVASNGLVQTEHCPCLPPFLSHALPLLLSQLTRTRAQTSMHMCLNVYVIRTNLWHDIGLNMPLQALLVTNEWPRPSQAMTWMHGRGPWTAHPQWDSTTLTELLEPPRRTSTCSSCPWRPSLS